jgi:protein TonB
LPHSAGADELSPAARRVLICSVLAAHGLGGWALLQVDVVRQAVLQDVPIMVSLMAAAEPPKPLPPKPRPPAPLPTPRRQKPRPAPTPLMAAAPTPVPVPVPVPAPAPVRFAVPMPEPAPVAAAVASLVAAPAPPARPAPPVAVALATPKRVPTSAVRYLVEPKMTVPLLSRRMGEQGTVYLLIVVDAQGRLKEASLQKS